MTKAMIAWLLPMVLAAGCQSPATADADGAANVAIPAAGGAMPATGGAAVDPRTGEADAPSPTAARGDLSAFDAEFAAAAKVGRDCGDMATLDIDRCGTEPEFRLDRYAGIWRVTRVYVAPGRARKFVADDPRIMGSEFILSSQQARWTHVAGDFNTRDVCDLPEAGPIGAIAGRDFFPQMLVGARQLIGRDAPVFRLGCSGGSADRSQWGPGPDKYSASSAFIPVGTDRMVLDWYDGLILLVDRVHSGVVEPWQRRDPWQERDLTRGVDRNSN